jgi:uridine kinase
MEFRNTRQPGYKAMAVTHLLKVLASKQPKAGATLFIAIDGRGGSGKSTLAKWLSEKLNAQVVRTDDFANWDNPLDWWPLVIERVFQPIQNGAQALNYPRSKWWQNHYPEPVVDQPVSDILILEGVGSSRKEFQDYVSFSIFIDTRKDICLQRGLERDSKVGKTREELRQMWEDWFEQEDKYFGQDQPQRRADIEIDGTTPFEDQISID